MKQTSRNLGAWRVAGSLWLLLVALSPRVAAQQEPQDPGDGAVPEIRAARELVDELAGAPLAEQADALIGRLRARYGHLRVQADQALRHIKESPGDARVAQEMGERHAKLSREALQTRSLIALLRSLSQPPGADVLGLSNGSELRAENIDGVAKWVDAVFDAVWRARDIPPQPPVDDAGFLRRATLDLAGRVPTLAERRQFFEVDATRRRDDLIDHLVASDDHARHLANYWNVHLLGRGYLPDDKHRDPFVAWLEREFGKNISHDRFARELITVSTSNTKEVSPNVFLSARQADPIANTNKIINTFLGLDMRCAQCHDDPYQRWTQDDFHSMVAFLARHREKNTGGNVYVQIDRESGEATYQTPAGEKHVASMRYYDGTTCSDYVLDENGEPKRGDNGKEIPGEKTRRQMLADKLTGDLQFARAQVNRVWAMLLGRGLVDPVEGFTEDNRPSVPLVLDVLARKFQESDFDNRWLVRVIARTRAYRLSALAVDGNSVEQERAAASFARYPLKALTGEQMFDAIVTATRYDDVLRKRVGTKEAVYRTLRSTHKVPEYRKQLLELRDDFLEVYAWEPEKVLDPEQGTIPQALSLANSRLTLDATAAHEGSLTQEAARLTPEEAVRRVFHATVVRDPAPGELERLSAHVAAAGEDGRASAVADVVWSLLNSAEFRYNH